MKTFYSLVKIFSNPQSGDNITIGIVLRDKNGFRYAFSSSKKQLARNLLVYNSEAVDYIEKQIVITLKKVNSSISKIKKDLFPSLETLNSQYFGYLNNYNNGVLQFTSPSVIFDDVDDEKFKKLFKLLVDQYEKIEDIKQSEQEANFFARVNIGLIEKVENQVHTNIKIDNTKVPSLLNPFQFDCIGLNGVLIGAKALPMNQSKQTLSAQATNFINVIVHLSVIYDKNILSNLFFLICDEPADINSSEHKLWELLIKENFFKVINSEEVGIIVNEIAARKATKFLAIE